MTAETASTLAEAFREHRDAFGVSLTLGETTVTALVKDSAMSRELVEGGFADEGAVEAKVLLADLPMQPSLGMTANYKSRPMRVSSLSIQPGGLIAELSLRPARR